MIKTNHYTITKESLPIHELIGLDVEIVQSTDPAKKGVRGKIVNETQRTFIVETKNGEKTIPKNESIFQFSLDRETVEANGKDLRYTPIERLKNGGSMQHV
jgi:ribonuclease P protein subunit POP4